MRTKLAYHKQNDHNAFHSTVLATDLKNERYLREKKPFISGQTVLFLFN